MESFGTTDKQAEAYRCEGCLKADVHIESHWDIAKKHYPQFSDDVGEYLFSGFSFYKQLLEYGGLMLHSSAVVVDGKCYLFTADSGTGKSTHTGLWLEKFKDRAYILNDDKPAVRLEEDGWFAYGTPWSGKHDISVNARVPLAGIACLERGQENSIEPFGGIAAIHAILKQCNRPKAEKYRQRLLELLDQLITSVPVWKLTCNMDPSAADVAYEAMSGNKER